MRQVGYSSRTSQEQLLARLTCDVLMLSTLSSNNIKGSRYFFQQETLPSLLCTG